MLNTATIQARLQAISSQGLGTGVGEPQLPASIAEIESRLAVSLPTEYREFLQLFGYLSVTDRYVCGVASASPLDKQTGNVVFETLHARETLGIPSGFVVISRDHEDHGYAVCLDLRKGGPEAPVVCWDPSTKRTVHWYDSFEQYLLEHLLGDEDV